MVQQIAIIFMLALGSGFPFILHKMQFYAHWHAVLTGKIKYINIYDFMCILNGQYNIGYAVYVFQPDG